MVQLYHILAGSDPLSHARQSKAANAVLTIMKELETVKFQYMPVLIGVSPVLACDSQITFFCHKV